MRSLRRLAAGLGLGLLLGVPALAAPALALVEPEAQPQVEFNGGGLGLLLCGSRPDRASVTVKSESRVVFVNNIGQGATLQIDGESGGPIADGQAVEVQFHHGPVAIAMVPDCILNLGGNGSYEPVTVNVTRSASTGSSGSKSAVRTKPAPRPKPSPTKTVALPPSTTVDQSPFFSLDPEDGSEVLADPSETPEPAPVGDTNTPFTAT